MIIIETCPMCGADLVDSVVCTNPPRQRKTCSKCDWSWTEDPEEVVRIPFVPPGQKREQVTWPRHDWNDGGNEYMFGWVPECCRNCSNHPSNGGSGICACTLPYMTRGKTVPTFSRATYVVTDKTITDYSPDIVVSDHT